ncbi:MAG: glycosyltransferase [Lactobacillaceae bacterium]|jgi:poly(glycerol-phosphate) alpha-glucosyltransferase|nr:glycosyltransferase [Lactobacillaceae bacterium]
MNYFVSENIFAFNSGTEHSQAKRVRLFNEKQPNSAVYVTRNYNRFLDRDRQGLDLTASDVLNMYDFFQGTTNVERKEQSLRLLDQIPLDEYHIIGHGANYSTLNHAGREIARINVMPATIGLVNEILYYDRAGNTLSRENYDWRGFKSSIDFFNPDGTLAVQQFLNQAGAPVIEIVHMNVKGKRYPTMWKLLNFRGVNLRFQSENELFLYFLNILANDNQGSTFVSDRRSVDLIVAEIIGAKAKFAYLHDIHTPDVSKPQKGALYDSYKVALIEKVQNFDGILVPTQGQRTDLTVRFPKATVRVAPDTYVNDATLAAAPVGLEQRVKNRLAFVGRLSPEKRPEDAIKVLAEVVKQVPDATLEFIGYAANTEILPNLKKQAEDAGLQDKVIFNEYGNYARVGEVLDNAQVLLQVSLGEGFGMNLVEGFAHGVPAISYDINYGARDLVTEGVDGYVVPSASANKAAERIVELLQNDEQWNAFSTAAYARTQSFSGDAMYANWQTALK